MTKAYLRHRTKFQVSWYVIFIGCLIFGVCCGALCCAYANTGVDKTLYDYLNNFFAEFSTRSDYISIVKRAISNHARMFMIILISGFFSAGPIFIGLSIAIDGFISGFTASAFVKYFGFSGIWLNVAYIPAYIILIPSMILFAVISSRFSVNKYKKEKKMLIEYILFALIIFAIFCVSALAEGYLTTICMKFIIQRIT